VFGNIGWSEGLLLILILLLLFGARRLPEMMRSMGHGVREFKKAVSGLDQPDEDESRKGESKQES
jgi:sec-independent protein translocase protein TatA